jgi:hypothetical protein
MNAPTNSPTAPQSKAALSGSFLSALVGWSTLNLAWYIESLSLPPEQTVWLPLEAIASAFVIFLVWLLILLPLYHIVPSDSILWRWPVCTLCGIVAGTLIACVVLFLLGPQLFVPYLPSILLKALYAGVLVGGPTCLIGSLTAPFFRGEVHLDIFPHRAIRHAKKLARWLRNKFMEVSGQ